jgi:ATP-dependent DNA helicase RecG
MPAEESPRKPISRSREGREVYRWVADEIRRAGRLFVYPLIGESEKPSLRDAETMYRRLSEKSPGGTVGLIHSRLPEENKREIMASFMPKNRILVATSVVEVGVDVPNATCMVVEHAERFGLSALHQLRGRVGRGTEQSYFFLVYDPALTEDAKRRLMVMKESSDGFMIAEEDLRIRGPGEILGVRQSGEFRLLAADLTRDADLLEHARDDAMSIVESDPVFSARKRGPSRGLQEASHTRMISWREAET